MAVEGYASQPLATSGGPRGPLEKGDWASLGVFLSTFGALFYRLVILGND